MMSRGVPESDWKLFRKLREAALERFTARTLDELVAVARDTSRTHHERYLATWELLRERDKQVARGFDNPGRSRMIEQLAFIHAKGLLEPDDFARFTQATRATIEGLVELER